MIYWDHNAAAPVRAEVGALLARAFTEGGFGNASSVHGGGREARARLDAARAKVARVLGCEPKEITFTASGSEADALALMGAYAARPAKDRRRVVSTTVEHPSALGALTQLEKDGAQVVRLSPDSNGRVPLESVLEALTPDTALCSLMWANNETGVLQPVAETARACRQRGILFHTDAVQAAGKVPLTLREVDADLLSLSAHKFGGPQGVGVLVVRKGVDVRALTPGHQEGGRRGGTQNVPYAEALALALELAAAEQANTAAKVAALRDTFEQQVLQRLPGVSVNGAGAPRVPNTSNLRFDGVEGEALLMALDLEDIRVSSGAACASGTLSPSHVLRAMGLSPTEARGSLRFSLGTGTTSAEVSRVVDALCTHVPRVRALEG
ncbi:cysteine desulfurase family protein [Corallococcus exiguus]|uniref:Aminotransferase class V-fold PLP-dependent enzyme n=1 Tax=Corallococcus exiguus TaxID=83462 RepID=A0A7X4YJC1_9BACT|nr:cysteine desulfurase family protein [Corallococcus exiguus]NBC45502.1 aminotransferase class V-fold PLP-dependent enzyme [Corallococcus exiguus]TNV61064.1 cysteine desulfurase [Corallococcus exiguus]